MHRRENFYHFVSTSWFSFPFFPYFLYPVTGGKIKGWSLADSLICHFLLKTDDLTEENKNLGRWIPISNSLFWPWERIWVFVSHFTAKCPAPQNYFGLHIYSCITLFLFLPPIFGVHTLKGMKLPDFSGLEKLPPHPLCLLPDMKISPLWKSGEPRVINFWTGDRTGYIGKWPLFLVVSMSGPKALDNSAQMEENV